MNCQIIVLIFFFSFFVFRMCEKTGEWDKIYMLGSKIRVADDCQNATLAKNIPEVT